MKLPSMTLISVSVVAFSLVALCHAANAQTYSVSDLGAVANFSEVTGAASVNARGDAVGQSISPAGTDRAFVWRNGQSLDLGTLAGVAAGAKGINALDVIAGTSDAPDGFEHAVLWIPSRPAFGAGAFTLLDLGSLGGNGSEGNGINVLSHVSGFAYTTVPDPTFTLNFGQEGHGFFWDRSMHDLGTLGGPNSIAIGINDRNWLVGWSQASFDLGSLGRRNDALSGQHAAVCDASKDVLFNQPTVKIDRLSEVLHKLIGPSREASASSSLAVATCPSASRTRARRMRASAPNHAGGSAGRLSSVTP